MPAPKLDIASVEARAQRAGRSFREQWLVDMEAAIAHEHDIRDRRSAAAEARRIAKENDAHIRAAEKALADAKRRLAEHNEAAKQREEEMRKRHQEAEERSRQERAAREEKLRQDKARVAEISRQRMESLERKHENNKRKRMGLPLLPELPMPSY